jgi:hypothetical protein
MTRESASEAATFRALELCERIREYAMREKEQALTDANSLDAFDSSFGENMEIHVRELIDLIHDMQLARPAVQSSEKLKKEIGFTLATIEDAINTVNEERKKVRGLIDESRLRRDAIRAYDSIHAS